MSQDPQPPYPLHPTIINRINPDYEAFYNEHIIDKQQAQLLPLEVSRSSGNLIPGAGPLIPVGKAADHAISRTASQGPAIPVRCFTPEGARPTNGWPTLVYFHGGGWVLGNIDTENVVATNICTRGKCVVVSVDYRLAPEYPFPAAVEDAWEAVLWVLGKGKDILGLDTTKLAVGGSSAGGNLAAIMCQRAAARGSPTFRLQLLNVPVTDNTADITNNASWALNQHTPALPVAKMLWFRNHYLPNKKDRENPEASPLLWEGDWSKLPPAIIILAELDMLRDEGEQYGKKLQDAGVKADIHVFKGQPHTFFAMNGILEDARQAITRFCESMLALSNGH